MRYTTTITKFFGVCFLGVIIIKTSVAANIDPSGQGNRYAWGENFGWINLLPGTANSVDVTASQITGFAWSENLGWINFSASPTGVQNDGNGHLSGFAWAENAGWINFTTSTNNPNGVWINACGEFNGYAWNENFGWINFRSDTAPKFKVVTSWVSPIDEVAPVTASQAPSGWNNSNVNVTLSASDCGHGVKSISHSINGGPLITSNASNANFLISGEGYNTITYYATDVDGNVEVLKQVTVKLDKTAPNIQISTPAQNAVYSINDNVYASFSVSDSLSGVVLTSSSVANGQALDTSTIGAKTFTVSATDSVGNKRNSTHNYSVHYPGNIDSANSGQQYAWSENAGWINFKPGRGPGVSVSSTQLSGYAWGENTGWINLNPNANGVKNDAKGNLSGMAWSENQGWINFNGVQINSAGDVQGYAWGENSGWINFDIAKGIHTDWSAPAKQAYCLAKGNNTNYEYISSIALNGNTKSSGNNQGYLDSTAQSPLLLHFGDNAMSLIPGFSSTIYVENWRIWIDFDKDGVFDADESVYANNSNAAINSTLNIPSSAFAGETRMRIAMRWSTGPAACGSFTYGEAEDYRVVIR